MAAISASEAGGELFQRADGLQHVADVLQREAAHHGALGRHQLDQPLARQRLDRLAQRCARHAELRAELRLDQSRAGGELPLDDEVAQMRDHLVMKRPAQDRRDGEPGVHLSLRPCLELGLNVA